MIIEAPSDIGRVIVRNPADGRRRVQFAVRDLGRLERGVPGLRGRAGVAVTLHCCDVLKDDGRVDPLPDCIVCVVGLLVASEESEGDVCRGEVDSRLIPDKERRGQVSGMTGSGCLGMTGSG